MIMTIMIKMMTNNNDKNYRDNNYKDNNDTDNNNKNTIIIIIASLTQSAPTSSEHSPASRDGEHPTGNTLPPSK